MANRKTGKKPAQNNSSAGRLVPVLLIVSGILLAVVAFLVIRSNNEPQTNFVPQVSGAPAISVEPAQIDMGNVTLGTPVRADFVVTNLGDKPLEFSEAPYIELVEGC